MKSNHQQKHTHSMSILKNLYLAYSKWYVHTSQTERTKRI